MVKKNLTLFKICCTLSLGTKSTKLSISGQGTKYLNLLNLFHLGQFERKQTHNSAHRRELTVWNQPSQYWNSEPKPFSSSQSNFFICLTSVDLYQRLVGTDQWSHSWLERRVKQWSCETVPSQSNEWEMFSVLQMKPCSLFVHAYV